LNQSDRDSVGCPTQGLPGGKKPADFGGLVDKVPGGDSGHVQQKCRTFGLCQTQCRIGLLGSDAVGLFQKRGFRCPVFVAEVGTTFEQMAL
jgi:hypothetical protein